METKNIIIAVLIFSSAVFSQEEKSNGIPDEIWELSAGYFAVNNDDDLCHGFAAYFGREDIEFKKLNWGWYFIFRIVPSNEPYLSTGGSISLGASLSYDFELGSGVLIAKTGLGLITTNTYPGLASILSVSYKHLLKKNLFLTVGITTELGGFKYFVPPMLSVGLAF